MGPPPLLDPPAIVAKAEPAVSGYALVMRRVLSGETVFTSDIPGEPAGLYRCFLENGKPKFESVAKAAPAVAAKKTFPNGGWHEGHQCPSCGREQFVVSGGFKYGVHTHTCSACGTTWSHGK
jgi:hypothetical protein